MDQQLQTLIAALSAAEEGTDLDDACADLRRHVARLGAPFLASPAAADLALSALADARPAVRCLALGLMSLSPRPSFALPAARALADPSPAVSQRAADLLCAPCGPSGALAALPDADAELRAAAGRAGRAESVAALRALAVALALRPPPAWAVGRAAELSGSADAATARAAAEELAELFGTDAGAAAAAAAERTGALRALAAAALESRAALRALAALASRGEPSLGVALRLGLVAAAAGEHWGPSDADGALALAQAAKWTAGRERLAADAPQALAEMCDSAESASAAAQARVAALEALADLCAWRDPPALVGQRLAGVAAACARACAGSAPHDVEVAALGLLASVAAREEGVRAVLGEAGALERLTDAVGALGDAPMLGARVAAARALGSSAALRSASPQWASRLARFASTDPVRLPTGHVTLQWNDA
eukprot:m51a1_g9147 hypothetical protein (428) ;mRNA; r:93043-94326